MVSLGRQQAIRSATQVREAGRRYPQIRKGNGLFLARQLDFAVIDFFYSDSILRLERI